MNTQDILDLLNQTIAKLQGNKVRAEITQMYGTKGRWAIILDQAVTFDPIKKNFVFNEGD